MAKNMEISMYLVMKHMARYMETSMYLATADWVRYTEISMYHMATLAKPTWKRDFRVRYT